MFQNPDHSDILFVSGAVQSKREDSQREDSCRTINRKEGNTKLKATLAREGGNH